MIDEDQVDSESMPKTEGYTPTFDTDAHDTPEVQPDQPGPRRRWWRRRSGPPATAADDEPTSGSAPAAEPATDDVPKSEPIHAPRQSITVPGRYHYLKWWQFILMLLAVWVPAAAIGPGLFYLWTQDNTAHKTPVVFVTLVYVVVCIVAGLMLAMVPDRPLVSALAIAMMSAVFASVAAAAPFYGAFFCDHTHGSCLMGIIPY